MKFLDYGKMAQPLHSSRYEKNRYSTFTMKSKRRTFPWICTWLKIL